MLADVELTSTIGSVVGDWRVVPAGYTVKWSFTLAAHSISYRAVFFEEGGPLEGVEVGSGHKVEHTVEHSVMSPAGPGNRDA